MTNLTMTAAPATDADLVHHCLAGNRDAFGQIVSRYQSLICSLAYSATGCLGQSEDLAQETFITAWKHLRHLRERDKLRSWLCGIARNRINNFLRREGREPLHAAESLEEVAESQAPGPLPVDQTISREEAELLWRALERIPETYREPLILYYREHQSLETVARNLDLTEDAAKQRLARGRKLLQEQVLAFVEGALTRTNPGKAFTLGVLAALPALTLSAKAATLGSAAAKGGATAKAASGGILAGVFGLVLILFGNYLGYRIGVDEARSEAERNHIKAFYRKIGVTTLLLAAGFGGFVAWICRNDFNQWLPPVLVINGSLVIYLLVAFAFVLITTPGRRKYYAQLAAQGAAAHAKPAFEYCSQTKLLGLPLVHIRIGDRFDILHQPVRAWIAVANYAFGGLFAFGGVVVAPVSIGFCALGLLPLGGLALGVLAFGGFAMGGWAFGGLTIGWQTVGCFAIAWQAAAGNLAWAHDFATGAIVHAAQANNPVADRFLESAPFFRLARVALNHAGWLNLLWVTPLFVQWRLILRKKRADAK